MVRQVGPGTALLVLCALAGCDRDPAREARARLDEAAKLNAPMPGAAGVDRPSVVFTDRALVIAELGVPVRPPVTAQSAASSATMASDDASVVKVDANGSLVGVRNGRTRVRSRTSGSVLDVEVHAVSAIRVEPDVIAVQPGGSAPIRVLDAGSGEELPAAAVTWAVTPTNGVSIQGGIVYAPERSGRVAIRARYGGATADAAVEVGARKAGGLVIGPGRASIRLGQVRMFEARAGASPVASAEWTSSDPGVVVGMGGGMFFAKGPGKTQVCARALGDRGCAEVEVLR
jgi:hypothetical protein